MSNSFGYQLVRREIFLLEAAQAVITIMKVIATAFPL